MSGRTSIRIGCGAGYSGDRIEPAVELAEHGNVDYLVFECLAERTIAIAQQARANDPQAGYDPLLIDRMDAVLPACRKNRVRVITNMGAANPVAAAAIVRQRARQLGLAGLNVAAVTGDDVLAEIKASDVVVAETGRPVREMADAIVSANAYMGAEPVVEALARGADVVITGRVGDSSLFLAPAVHEFGWRFDDWIRVAAGTLVGHLLECAGQITGGYFADPGRKDVPSLARLGFPIAEVSDDGTAFITKVEGSGGTVSLATCTEQFLYEIGDPGQYITADVTADFRNVRLTEAGVDRVRVEGATGRALPDMLKVAIGYRDGFIGEGQISYAGSGAVERAMLARDIVAERFGIIGLQAEEVRYDVIGLNALHGAASRHARGQPYEVRLRVAARTSSMKDAVRVGNEVETLYTNGPAGGGGATKSAREVLAVASTFVPRERVSWSVALEVA
jgi:acyclic terpene utilization AtuA family protein